MFQNRSVEVHQFSMVPRADIPRSSFVMEKALKTTFDGGNLVPILAMEVLPGDTFNVEMTAFCRLATPIFPFMDNLHLETFFFFVPNRLVWLNWPKFMGEQENPDDSTDYLVPQCTSPLDGYAVNSLQDYFGIPPVPASVVDGTVVHNNLVMRAYNLIYNQWFRDENLIDSVVVDKDDGPDDPADYVLLKRGKRHDYFTSCLPWPQKGESVPLPLGVSAPVRTSAMSLVTGEQSPMTMRYAGAGGPTNSAVLASSASGQLAQGSTSPGTVGATIYPDNLYADLSEATAATINQLRQSFQIQKLLERDARGGTRYTEIIRAHFGVMSPDARLQRPEYLGGGRTHVAVNPIAQTSATTVTGTTSPQGNLAAMGTALARNHGFNQSFTEHGHIIGIVNVRADLTYQQGLHRMWSRRTRYDFYFPVFAALGEQAVMLDELWYDHAGPGSMSVFGYQERWAEYRYSPSQITGRMRSGITGSLDAWHLAQLFAGGSEFPVLNQEFIEDTATFQGVQRVSAVGEDADGVQFLMDAFFRMRVARPMPMYSVPGFIDHF